MSQFLAPREFELTGFQDLERYQDEEVARLRDSMNLAADQDMEANLDKRPATAKLRMLPEVMEILQRLEFETLLREFR